MKRNCSQPSINQSDRINDADELTVAATESQKQWLLHLATAIRAYTVTTHARLPINNIHIVHASI